MRVQRIYGHTDNVGQIELIELDRKIHVGAGFG